MILHVLKHTCYLTLIILFFSKKNLQDGHQSWKMGLNVFHVLLQLFQRNVLPLTDYSTYFLLINRSAKYWPVERTNTCPIPYWTCKALNRYKRRRSKVNASIFGSALSPTRRSDASEKKKKIAWWRCVHFWTFLPVDKFRVLACVG